MSVVLCGNVMLQGHMLVPGGELHQAGYTLVMQKDSNLVLYSKAGKANWASGTDGKGSNSYFVMQKDGNAVVYSGNGKAIWASGTHGRNDGDHYLILQNDGNFVMYTGAGTPIWATNTSNN